VNQMQIKKSTATNSNLIFFVLSIVIFLYGQSLYAAKPAPVPAATPLSCSNNQLGAGVINEINTNNNFVEIYLLEGTDISDWKIKIDPSSNGQAAIVIDVNSCTSSSVVISGNSFSGGTFFACDVSMNPSNDEVVLVDGADNVIDYLGYGKLTPSAVWDVPAECGSLYPGHKANNQDIARLPDGEGALIDNASNSTKGSTNGGNGGGTVDELAENFNCIETSSLTPNTAQIYTKLAGVNFNLDIVALKNGALVNQYKKLVKVEIIDQATGSALLTDAAFQFDASDNSRKVFPVSLGNKAYKNLICKVTYMPNENANESSHVIGWSDNFSVRPFSFSSLSSSMDNATSGAGTTAKAGTDQFTITASTNTAGYDGTPKYKSLLKDHNNSDQDGKLSGNFSAANEPTLDATGAGFIYKEVGLVKFAVNDIYDDSFTAVDQTGDCSDDYSNVLVNGKYGCQFGNEAEFIIGRFVPDHFSLVSSSITPACNSFTYMGETFGISYTLEAQNGVDEVTTNYHYSVSNNYAKASDISLAAEYIPVGGTTSQDLSSRVSTLYEPSLWLNGQYQLTNSDVLFNRASSADGAYDDLELGIKVVDSDAVVLGARDMLASDNINSACAAADCLEVKIGTTNIRFGRLKMDNAYGSELTALSSPLYTEYFNGSFFVLNIADNCTAINLAELRFNGDVNPEVAVGGGTSTATLANIPVASGQAGLAFSAPAAGNTGSIDISVNSLFEWLKFDWDGDGSHDNTPTSRATFGLYKGNQKQIYFREVY